MQSDNGAVELISINDADDRGITRIRLPKWKIPLDHLLLGGLCFQLYSPLNVGVNGRDPIPILSLNFDPDEKIFEPYTGPLPDSPEYKEEVERFSTTLSRTEQPRTVPW